MRCYNILEQNPYYFLLSRDKVELEDADDDFLTETEFKEMGLRVTYYGFAMFESKVKRAVKKWVAQIPSGGSVTCTDADLIDCLKEYFKTQCAGVSDLLGEDRGQVGGVLRSGNKFKLRGKGKVGKPAERKLRKTDWFKLMNMAKVCLNDLGLSIDGIDVPNRHLTLTSIKKVVRWCDMVDAGEKGWYDSQYFKKHATKEDMVMVKRMWWKPEIVTDIGRKK